MNVAWWVAITLIVYKSVVLSGRARGVLKLLVHNDKCIYWWLNRTRTYAILFYMWICPNNLKLRCGCILWLYVMFEGLFIVTLFIMENPILWNSAREHYENQFYHIPEEPKDSLVQQLIREWPETTSVG